VNPLEQFTVRPILPLHLFGYDVSFTNQSLFMGAGGGGDVALPHTRRQAGPAGADPQPVHGRDVLRIRRRHDPFGDRHRRAEILPFIFTLFMFVLVSNFMGMLPFAFTVTSQIAVTSPWPPLSFC